MIKAGRPPLLATGDALPPLLGSPPTGTLRLDPAGGMVPQERDIGYLLPMGGALHYGAANT